jgi:hypothetical protein
MKGGIWGPLPGRKSLEFRPLVKLQEGGLKRLDSGSGEYQWRKEESGREDFTPFQASSPDAFRR